MLDLDYAFLADYASIQDGKLTTVGASFTRMRVPQVPTRAFIAVAGRIRCDDPRREEIMMTLRIASPGEDPLVFETSYQLDASLKAYEPYAGNRRGIIFAVQMAVPLMVLGTYTVEIDIEDTTDLDRVLKFEVDTEETSDK